MIDYILTKGLLQKALNKFKTEKMIEVHDKKKGTYYRKQKVNAETPINQGKQNFTKKSHDPDAKLSPEQKVYVQDLEKKFSSWINGFNNNEKSGIEDYSRMSFIKINKHYRGTLKPPPSGEELKKLELTAFYIKSALDKSEIKKPLTVYRKIRGTDLISKLKGCLNTETVWEEKAFMSTTVIQNSFNSSQTSNVINMVIDLPKGKGIGGFIKSVSAYPKEQEFLLNRGARFKVESIENEGSNYTVHLKLVGRSE